MFASSSRGGGFMLIRSSLTFKTNPSSKSSFYSTLSVPSIATKTPTAAANDHHLFHEKTRKRLEPRVAAHLKATCEDVQERNPPIKPFLHSQPSVYFPQEEQQARLNASIDFSADARRPSRNLANYSQFEEERKKDIKDAYEPLLKKCSKVIHTTPSTGSELHGIHLISLSPSMLAMLGDLVADRGVVMLRRQENLEDVDEYVRVGRNYSELLHIHQTYPILKGKPYVHVIGSQDHDLNMMERVSTSVRWHSDVTYELQPPGFTILVLGDGPNIGGDTVWSNQYEALSRLSPPFQTFLSSLSARHSGVEQANMALREGLPLRRDPISSIHPVVRTHPITGRKALFVNPMFTREIVGLKEEESKAILDYLYRHVAVGLDFQARMKWEKGTIAIWDNRCTMHTGLMDYDLSTDTRHAYRITPQAEKPFF